VCLIHWASFVHSYWKGKLLFHKATNLGLLWDDALLEDIRIAFDEWRRRLPELQNIQIPRWVPSRETAGGEKEIHTFCYASEEGYGCTLYERTIAPDGTAHTSLIFAKARLVPHNILKQAQGSRESSWEHTEVGIGRRVSS
jgi:hypothetical protein